jgi:hypothetical protein
MNWLRLNFKDWVAEKKKKKQRDAGQPETFYLRRECPLSKYKIMQYHKMFFPYYVEKLVFILFSFLPNQGTYSLYQVQVHSLILGDYGKSYFRTHVLS